MDDATNPNIKERPLKKMLRCDLTAEELRSLADSIAEDQANLESLENEKKAVTKDYAGRIESVQGAIRRNSSTYRQGWDLREVQCSNIMDFEHAEVRIVRLDTHQTVERRKMTQDELTLPLPLDDLDEAAA